MKKTSIYIEAALDLRLATIAEQQGISKAEFIRRALESEATRQSYVQVRSIGVFAGPHDLSSNVDKYLEGFGED